MSPVDARTVQLLAELRRDWQSVRAQLHRAQSVDPQAGAPECAYVALALDHAYQAFESFMKRLEQGLGLQPRSGANWHSELLEDASLDLPSVRPPLVSADGLRAWRELLKFRHFLRHAYGAELEAPQLLANREHLRVAFTTTSPHVEALLEALQKSV